jgi:hypothetical protein
MRTDWSIEDVMISAKQNCQDKNAYKKFMKDQEIVILIFEMEKLKNKELTLEKYLDDSFEHMLEYAQLIGVI